MGKNDFDIDFDFEEEYGFDPKSFLGTEEFDDKIDLDAFSDEELGLTSRKKKADNSRDDFSGNFDLDEDLDTEDFLNMGSQEEETEEEEEEEDELEEEEYEEDSSESSEAYAPEFEEDPQPYEEAYTEEVYDEEIQEDADLTEETDAEETEMNENMDYTEEEALEASVDYEEEIPEEGDYDGSDAEFDDKPVKERKPIKLPKITLPKLKTPNIFTKFFDLYFAPVLHKELREEPQDPNNPRRRRRKSQKQIFKEFYLPPITVCICLILVMTFLIGSLSNAIELKRIDDKNQQSQLDASVSAAELEAQQNERIVEQAAQLAAGYDYKGAIDLLETINGGDLTKYPDIANKRSEYATIQSQLVEHKEPSLIPNLSFHVLIADPARAFKDEQYGGSYNKNFVTIDEFSKILNELYNNGYVLVDFDSFVASNTEVDGNEKFFVDTIYLPEGKKPVMITETMVNYFNYMNDSNQDGIADANGDGFASRLVLDGSGNIRAEYVDSNGQTQVGNYDLVPILEDFIKAHPDFSYRGARATLAVTGHEGVFGYRCNTSYIGTKGQAFYDQEVAGAKQIVNALREKGYTIACYTYSNDAYANFSVAQISANLTSWTNEVTNVIGPVDTFVFAKNSNITDYSGQAFNVLYQSGFRYFIAHGNKPYAEINTTYVRQNRLMVTGENMAWYASQFTDHGLFNPNSVLDLTSRGNIPKS